MRIIGGLLRKRREEAGVSVPGSEAFITEWGYMTSHFTC